MTAKASAQQFLSGRLTRVDCERIERELRDIWQSAQDSRKADTDAVSRTCAASLVVYSQSGNAEVEISPVLDELAAAHPLRAILAVDHPASKDFGIEARVSARCNLLADSGNKHICCEQITIKKGGADPRQLPSVVLPLLVPDLPVFLWWNCPSITTELVAPFLSSIDRLIVDSSDWMNLKPFKELSELMADIGKAPGLSDLSWQRLLVWRKALASIWPSLAQLWGGEPACSLSEVVITIEGDNRVQQVLLTAWLAARLQWQKSSFDIKKAEFVFNTEDRRDITVRLLQTDSQSPAPAGTITELKLLCATGNTVTLTMHDQEGWQIVILTACGAEESAMLVARGGALSLSGLVGAELSDDSSGPVFAETLKKLATFNELF